VRLLVVGASGHLGGEVCRQAVEAGWAVVGTFHREPGSVPGVLWELLDVRDRVAVSDVVEAVGATAVVNCAASYSEWAVSAVGAAHVAAAAAAVGTRLVHVSSDAVHGGRPEPYADDELPTPIHQYGAAKAAAETAVRVVDPAAAIVRTSLIIGDAESRQVKLCLDLLTGRMPRAALFSDEIRCPMAVEDLAAATLELAASDHAGLLNVAGPDAVSRVELAVLVAARYGLDPAGMPVSTIADSGQVRPGHVRLDSSRAAGLLRTRLRGVRELLGG